MALLQGKAALITGGSRGIGRGIVERFLQEGADVAFTYVSNPEKSEALAAELAAGSGRRAIAIRSDAGDMAQAQAAVDAAVEAFGRLDVLVNNAAVDFTLPIDELTLEQWDEVIRVNLRAPFVLARLAARVMRDQGGGQIVNIVSTAAKRAWPNASAYHASKWGLLGLSHALHAELRPRRIKVSAIVAGGMRTPFLLDRFPDIDPGVLQDPANVAATIRFLLTLPEESVIPEVMVIPMRESSWP